MAHTYVLYASLALTWLLLLGLAVSVLRIQRDVINISRSLESRAAEGLPVGAVAPSLEGDVITVDGNRRHADSQVEIQSYSKPTVVWFMAAGCQPCLSSRKAINLVAAEYREKADMIVNCVGDVAAVTYFAEELRGPTTIVSDPKRINAQEWRVVTV